MNKKLNIIKTANINPQLLNINEFLTISKTFTLGWLAEYNRKILNKIIKQIKENKENE
jgi:hypothetical protein